MDIAEQAWHYPRPAAASNFLEQLARGAFNILVMFERRRSGKTELLLYDVAPAAETAGYRVVYVNLWSSSLSPAAQFATAFQQALRARSLAERLKDFMTTPVTRLKVSGELIGAKGELEIELADAESTKVQTNLVLAVNAYAAQLAARRQKVLLLVDEVQTLAESKSNEPLVKALRTLLDTHKSRIKAIFTGSSREGLHAVFSRVAAPFFRSGTFVDLPEMDRGFVQHLLAVYERITQRKADEVRAMKCFEDLRRSPYYFRRLVDVAIDTAETDFDKVLGLMRVRLPTEMGYLQKWVGLKPLDRAVVREVAAGNQSLFASGTRKSLAVRGRAPSASDVQNAVRRLLRQDVLIKLSGEKLSTKGVYALDDDEFGVWALSLKD